MGLSAKTAKLPEVFKLYKVLCSAKLKAAYKCDLFEKEFAPLVKKTSTQKANAKKATAKASTKKTSTKKTEVKTTTKKSSKKTSK